MSTPELLSPEAQRAYGILSRRRTTLVRRLTLITLVAFFTQQILTNFTDVLDGFVVEGLSLAYLYAIGLFVLVVVLTTAYTRAMDRIERQIAAEEVDR